MKAEEYLHIETPSDIESLRIEIERLRRAEIELQKRIDILEARNRRVVESSRQSSRLIAGLSHELRTPLTSIIGFSEILLDDKDDPLTPNQRNLLARVNKNADRLLHLINDLLDLSKMKSGRMTLRHSNVDVPSLIRQVIETMHPLVRDEDIHLLHECDDNVPIIRTDEQKLSQILVNLVSNAIKFTPGGCVTVRAGLLDGQLSISVTDTGIGIRRADYGAIFEEFRQIDGHRSHRKGTGLGLAITRQLVHVLGGEIHVSSKLGEGSTFTVTLPLSYAAGT